MKYSDSVNWFARIDDRRAPNVKQYLRGLRKYRNAKLNTLSPYNFYLLWGSVLVAYTGVKYLKHALKSEFDQREQPNIFVPKAVYRIRRLHYVYWEISRVARGLPKTFTYSTWDEKARMMYHVDLDGQMIFEKLNLREERIDLLQNPLLGPLLRRKDKLVEDDLLTERANRIAIYYLNIHKRYDLDNYLHYKPIVAADFVRAAYYLFMIWTGLADTYRNEQYLGKSDYFYDLEREMLMLNFNSPDKGKVSLNILKTLRHDLTALIDFADSLDWAKKS